MVIHRSDLHGIFLQACERAGVDLVTSQSAVGFENSDRGAMVTFEDGHVEEASVVIAADGLHSVARKLLVDDQPVNSSYVAYRGAVPIDQASSRPRRSRARRTGVRRTSWTQPSRAPASRCSRGSRSCGATKWWRMFDRDPIMNWVHGRIALLGDAAHPPLQYMAQGAIMAIEDGWVLGEHVGRQLAAGTEPTDLGWDVALAAYNAIRPEHCRRVLTTGRVWGELWHHDGIKRLQRNAILRARETYDYTFTEWIYGPTALTPEEEPGMYPVVPLDSVDVTAEEQGLISAS